MLFNSLEFAVFFAAVWALYLLLPHRPQNALLLLASYVFYGAWDWRFLGLLAFSTAIDWYAALRLQASADTRVRRRWLLLSLVTNLGLLGVFKYFDFFTSSFAALLGALGLGVHPLLLDVVLPVGISFYTFQSLSYTIDVWRGELRAVRRLDDFALFVAFFPQLVAGPIERARRLLPQVLAPRRVTWAGTGSGGWLILSGLFKKVVIADNLAGLVNAVYGDAAHATGLEVLLATWAFAWQIYGDFSGYSDMARGLARLLGFELMLNFDLPYLATSASDFWRRWHISLSTWLRDYLYIPLGGNRGGVARTYRNLALTMLLGGLWHGAAWTFVLWGAWQGALLIGQRVLRAATGPPAARESRAPSATPADARARRVPLLSGVSWALRVLVMFQLTCFGWLLFRAESLSHAGLLLSRLVEAPGLGRLETWWLPFTVLVLPLLLYQLLQAWTRDLQLVLRWPLLVRAGVYAVLVLAITALGEDFGSPFIYFQF